MESQHTTDPWQLVQVDTERLEIDTRLVKATAALAIGGSCHKLTCTGYAILPEEFLANMHLIAAAKDLLAFAECSAAMDCDKLDPRYDAQPVLQSHGWNGEENPGVFLARIRRDALNKAVGHYLGRAAA